MAARQVIRWRPGRDGLSCAGCVGRVSVRGTQRWRSLVLGYLEVGKVRRFGVDPVEVCLVFCESEGTGETMCLVTRSVSRCNDCGWYRSSSV